MGANEKGRIELLAYEIWLALGKPQNQDLDIWLKAEKWLEKLRKDEQEESLVDYYSYTR